MWILVTQLIEGSLTGEVVENDVNSSLVERASRWKDGVMLHFTSGNSIVIKEPFSYWADKVKEERNGSC
jgi:hypothetical protein